MDSIAAVAAVVVLALWVWPLLTNGLTYLAREATIFNFIRLPLVFKIRPLASLLGCGQCTSLWTGMASYAVLLPIVGVFLDVPWWLWLCTPIAGVCGTGLFDRMSRASLAGPIDRLVKVLQQPPPDDAREPEPIEDGKNGEVASDG